MTLKNMLSVVLLGSSLMSAVVAEAFLTPGIRPGPVRPDPRGPDYGPIPPGYGHVDSRTLYLNRRVVNEELALRQLMGLDESYRGYEVQQVLVNVQSSGPRSGLSLVVNGMIEERVMAPLGTVALEPRRDRILGQEIQTLRLRVDGQMHIDTVTVVLVDARGNRPDRPERPGREQVVEINAYARLYGQGRLDLTPYIDMHRLYGMRIVAVEIEAQATGNAALMDLLINGRMEGRTMTVGGRERMHSVRPVQAIIGQTASSLVLSTRGNIEILGARLILSRY